MKKKGLIVATIVMVLVLAVSLTTATYAWFSASVEAEVEELTLTVGQSPNLLIGVKSKAIGTETTGYPDYKAGTMTRSADTWLGSNALGTTDVIDFTETLTGGGDSWGIQMAASCATTDLTDVLTSNTISAGSWFKAQGDGDNYTETSVQAAVNGTDYLDATFVVGVGKDGLIYQTYMQITVKPDYADNIGMAAALHFFIAVGDAGEAEDDFTAMTYLSPAIGGAYTDSPDTLSAYQGKTYANAFSETVTVGEVDGDGNWVLYVPIHDHTGAFLKTGFATSKQVRIIIWVEGYDDACVTANAGTGASIQISFNEVQDSTAVEINNKGQMGA